MQITDHVHSLRIPFEIVTPDGTLERFVIIYVVAGESVTLIDAGVSGTCQAVAAYLKAIGRDIHEVTTLVLTHAHPDHVGGAKALRERSLCAVSVHAAERAWVEDTALQARERPVPGFDRLVGGSVPVARALQDGDCLKLGEGLTLEVLHTPGHSKGSVSLLLREEGALFTGDVVPVPGSMPIFDSARESIESLQRLRELPGVEVLLSAWDEPRWGDDARATIDAGIAWMEKVCAAVRTARAEPGDPNDPLDLCRRVLPAIGLPPGLANPLIARSFAGVE